MNEDQQRRWDVIIKVGGVLGFVASALIGIWQFQDIRDRELAQFAQEAERDFYSEFWNERLRLYIQTLDTTAAISKANSASTAADSILAFRTLFDGSMAVVQDPVVDRAMHEFAEKVDAVESGEMTPGELGIHSYMLGRICYRSLRDSWDRPFNASEDGMPSASP